jgi:hypothetical protein
MHARKRGVESFEKLSREGKINRKVWVWTRKKKRKKEKIYERKNKEEMKEWKKKKRKEEVAIKIWEGWIKWKKGKIKCKEGCHVVERRNYHSFPTMCNPTTRTSPMPCSHNFLLPLHMSTILNLLNLNIPTYG